MTTTAANQKNSFFLGINAVLFTSFFSFLIYAITSFLKVESRDELFLIYFAIISFIVVHSFDENIGNVGIIIVNLSIGIFAFFAYNNNPSLLILISIIVLISSVLYIVRGFNAISVVAPYIILAFLQFVNTTSNNKIGAINSIKSGEIKRLEMMGMKEISVDVQDNRNNEYKCDLKCFDPLSNEWRETTIIYKWNPANKSYYRSDGKMGGIERPTN
jgi:hypothetical protein